jgi:lipoprotein-anchoring transpeptidase ErfK/SrfK
VKVPTMLRRLSASLLAVALVLSMAPAVAGAAAVRGPVPNDATVGGVSLKGMAEADARSAIAAAVQVPSLAPLPVEPVGKRTCTMTADGFVRVDVEGILAAAYAPTTTPTFELVPLYSVDSKAVRSWIQSVAGLYEKAPVDSKRVVRKRRLVVTKSVAGLVVDRTATADAISRALLASAAAQGAAQPAALLTLAPALPKVTEKNIGKAILVVLGERRLYLYGNAAVQRTFRCAIGQAKYPTPRGTFKIVGKAARPSWHNPGSAWAKRMPNRIAPGPNNPLGLRALYLNVSGIRIHGTNKLSSIGSPASHGCIRLANSDILKLYPLVPMGTTAYVIK